MHLPDINAVIFGRTMAKMGLGTTHTTARSGRARFFFSFWVLEAHGEPRSLLVSYRARGARNENKNSDMNGRVASKDAEGGRCATTVGWRRLNISATPQVNQRMKKQVLLATQKPRVM